MISENWTSGRDKGRHLTHCRCVPACSQLVAAVKDKSDVGEGYKMIVESIAGV